MLLHFHVVMICDFNEEFFSELYELYSVKDELKLKKEEVEWEKTSLKCNWDVLNFYKKTAFYNGK